MLRNHSLSPEFDISQTFREKIRNKSIQEDNESIDFEKINKLIRLKDKIDYIEDNAHSGYNVYFNGEHFVLNKDELIILIRETPHLYYIKKNEMFINLKLIRTFEYRENERVSISYKIREKTYTASTRFEDFEEFFYIIENLSMPTILLFDFFEFSMKDKKGNIYKLIRKNLFTGKTKHLEENNRFSLVNVFAVSLFYFIPFIPYVGINTYSAAIFPITTLLIGFLFYRRRQIKKEIINMR